MTQVRTVRGLACATLCATLLANTALAQGDCFPAATSNEARTFATKAVGIGFAPFTGTTPPAAGTIRVGLETGYVPRVDDATATPTVCRPGKGPENANLLAILVRPRVLVGLPGRFAFEAGWIPPIRVASVRSNLIGMAVRRVFALGSGGGTTTLRAHGLLGTVRAPITCPDEALLDPQSECFEGTRSDDRYQPRSYGVDATVSFGLGPSGLRWYAGGGYTRLEPRFQVNFTNRQGSTDNRRVSVGLNRAAVFGGLVWSSSSGVDVAGEVYSTPADAVTGRLQVSVRPGG